MKWGGRRAQRLTQLTLDTYGTTCHICGRPGATTADHLIPRSHGGLDTIANLRPAHKSCNSARGNRPLATHPTNSLSFFSQTLPDGSPATPVLSPEIH